MKRKQVVFATAVIVLSALVWMARAPARAAAVSVENGFNFKAVFAAAGGGPIAPCRAIADPYPEFNSIALDTQNHIAVMSDNAKKSAIVYDLSAGASPADTGITPYKTMIRGFATNIASPAGVALDPIARRIYVADNDIGESIGSFPYGANGNYTAKALAVPVGAYGIGLSQRLHQEAITEEDQAMIMVFRLGASGAEPPLREIRGPLTRMADPRGLVWDDQNHEITVANQGAWNRGYWDNDYNGGGHYFPPSIVTFADTAKGNAAPIRVIEGPNTQLNWPFQIALDTVHNEIAVANLGDNSVLIFKRTAQGNVSPLRVIKGPHTGFQYPIGVAFDTVHNELWVANDGHDAMIFDRTAEGDAVPKRVIRTAPAGSPVVGISNPFEMSYDSRRDVLLVRN